MHPDIAAIPNRLFYDSQLVDGARVKEQTTSIAQNPPSSGNALVLYDLTKLSAFCFSEEESHSRFNFISALVAVNLAYANVRAGNSNIGIITPYNAQSRLIHRLLKDLSIAEKLVKVATVHRFQGSEQDVIIFDTVEGPPREKPGLLVTGGMDSTAMRLANVAISRARGKFIGIVNYSYLQNKLNSFNIFRKLIDRVAARASIHSITWSKEASANNWKLDLPGVTCFPNSHTALKQIESEITKAKEEIAINWSTPLAKHHFSASILKRCHPERVRFYITGQGYQSFAIGLQNTQIWQGRSQLNISLVGIDRQCLWIYVNPASPNSVVLRLDLPQTVKLLYAFWRLVPSEEVKQDTLLEKIAKGQSPVGMPCPVCRSLLYPTVGKYGAYLACTNKNKCRYTKSMSSTDATNWAHLNNIKCTKCRSQVKGCKGYKGVFLRCTNSKCDGWTPLENFVSSIQNFLFCRKPQDLTDFRCPAGITYSKPGQFLTIPSPLGFIFLGFSVYCRWQFFLTRNARLANARLLTALAVLYS
ncbi:C-terminal helicase domain-containing protein [Scytonema millei]|uniref:DNA2/NAM7 helicase-like C-terminal domain-containing protein n=1 Tax=Scytonema millei VB511283 TaxID=1245923 RepID=A0A9X5E2X2_9CYAN|nr:AAA domain-containing protein [Scytonema millei]NHC34295.1 hypothetical protein [Scytonema millei VB511283]